MGIFNDFTELIGNTPLLFLEKFGKNRKLNGKIFAKLENFNPAGSAKDRAALAMIEQAERDGKLKRGSVIIEPTSGNTGIGLAAVAAVKGYRVVLTMPDTMSEERRKLLRAYGAEIVLTEGRKGMAGAIDRAKEIARDTEGSFLPSQFENSANPRAHYQTTGPEIWRDTGGEFDIFVASVGTGGTLSGAGKFLKEKNPNLKVVAVEPAASPVLSGGKAGVHGIQGIGAGFVPDTLDRSVCDEVMTVSDEEAFCVGRELIKTEGILAGISSGAALHAAAEIARREENKGKRIVVVFPDSGDRYFSTPLFL